MDGRFRPPLFRLNDNLFQRKRYGHCGHYRHWRYCPALNPPDSIEVKLRRHIRAPLRFSYYLIDKVPLVH